MHARRRLIQQCTAMEYPFAYELNTKKKIIQFYRNVDDFDCILIIYLNLNHVSCDKRLCPKPNPTMNNVLLLLPHRPRPTTHFNILEKC